METKCISPKRSATLRLICIFDIEYEVTRRERIAWSQSPRLVAAALTGKERRDDLQPDALVPITGLPAELAVKVTAGKTQTLDKARAIYDYVFTTMGYDKTGTGWGRGDVLYACDAKKGNCTDFHSLFIAMSRSQGIPARLKSDSLCPRANIPARSQAITAGRTF